jgi:hypothetical protein
MTGKLKTMKMAKMAHGNEYRIQEMILYQFVPQLGLNPDIDLRTALQATYIAISIPLDQHLGTSITKTGKKRKLLQRHHAIGRAWSPTALLSLAQRCLTVECTFTRGV